MSSAGGQLAPADSLVGQLQRGQGRGFLRALQEDPILIRPLLLDCVIHDPRWERQLESRSAYYAELIQQAALPLDAFEVYLRHNQHDVLDLVLATVCALAVRADVAAAAILRAYLTYGSEWGKAFEALMDAPDAPVSIDDVSSSIDQRFPEEDTLKNELFSVVPLEATQQEPWRSLRLVNPRVDNIMVSWERQAEQRQLDKLQLAARLANLSTPELLAAAIDRRTADSAALALQKRVTTADLDSLLHEVEAGDRWQRFVALSGLQRLAHPAALPILLTFFQSPDTHSRSLYGAAQRAIVALPAAVTLDLARSWFAASDDLQRHVALQLLHAHATVADVQLIRNALLLSLQRDTPDSNECYRQWSMLEILARFPEAGPYPEVETVFKEAGHSYTRVYAAQVLNTSAPEHFAHGLALECLWDCEEDVRHIGCDNVDLALPGARTRLQALGGQRAASPL